MSIARPLARFTAGLVLGAAVQVTAQSPSSSDDPVLISNRFVGVRQSDLRLELTRLPPELRDGFLNSEKRVNELLRRILLERTLASHATAEKLDVRPENSARLAQEREKLLAKFKVEEIEAAASAEFDAKRAQWEARARELYVVDRAKYATPEQVSASHILFDAKGRTNDEARKLVDGARAKIIAGADFNVLAREVSDDRSAKTNGGRLGWFSAAEMDPAFSKAAFALVKSGDISEPVRSSFGWHIIRLEGRRAPAQKPYEEVRDAILLELKQKYVNDAREAVLAALRSDAEIQVNQGAIDALIIRVDREAVRRAVEQVAPGAMSPASK